MTSFRLLIAALGAAAGLALPVGCATGPSPRAVSVLYAGSLVNLMEHDLGPAFSHADRYGFQGIAAGSGALVAQIKSKVRHGDVFISASPQANLALRGVANGSWLSWYIAFAKAPLVLGYNPHAAFAARLRTRPWYEAITGPGVRIGRTDPALDPKGKLTVAALRHAARALGRPALASALKRFPVFPEESLVGRLQAGQLDAGFFYSAEATEQHIPFVALTGTSESATYTVSILARAAHPAGAEAFLAFLLGPRGRSIMRRHGLAVLAGRIHGNRAGVPGPVLAAMAHS